LIRAATTPAEVPADTTASINAVTLPSDISLARECGACNAVSPSGAGACGACGGTVHIIPVPYVLLSKFRLDKRIGCGGMGIVYRARDTRLGRAVALKFLSPERALNTTARARFLREAQAASALDHPNIAAIYEIGEWNGQPFIAMAYCEGGTLKDRIRPGGMDCAEARAIITQIASGLAAAHAAGIVHRDLKPANVALTGSGQVKILDFGLAKLKPPDVGTERSLTEEGALLGTMMYMSPEQIRSKEAGPRSDLWALGTLAYEILAGIHPFQVGAASDVCRRILEDTPAPLDQVRAGVPPALARLVEGLLEKEPSARIASAEEVVMALSVREP
jgi:serine/threonine protein kinase